MADKDVTTLSGSIFAMEFSATDNIAIAAAIPINEATFIPVVNDEIASFTPFRRSENCSAIFDVFFSNRPSIPSFIVLNTPDNFFATANIPPLANPANRSPAETFSLIQENTFFTASKIFVAALQIVVFTTENTSPSDSTFSRAGSITPAIPRNVSKIPSDSFDKNSLTFPLSLRDVKKSPTDAVMFSNPSMIPFSPPEPRNFPIGLIIEENPFFKRSTAENTPLKVLFSLSEVSSLIFNPSVKDLNLSINLLNCFEVVGGNTSLKASLTGLTTSPKVLKIFLKDSISFSLPPSLSIPSISLSIFPVRFLVSDVASFNALRVDSSTMPVGSMPFSSWNAFIADWVAGPRIPSTPVCPISRPCFCNASWTFFTSSPVDHISNSRLTLLKSTIPERRLLTASLRISVEAAPERNTFSNDPYCSIKASTSNPWDVAVSFNCSSKVLVSIPASFILEISFSQLFDSAPSSKLFLRSAEALSILLTESDIPVNNSFA